MTFYSILKTHLLGDLLLVASPTHLSGVYFSGRKHAPSVGDDWTLDPNQFSLRQSAREIQEYLEGKRTTFSPALSPAGTPFQREIWRQIALIPYGQTITYSQLAARAGAPAAIRAAGTATGQNPLSIIVPCHRIVGKKGSLTGYAGGSERKASLLQIEEKGLPLPAKNVQAANAPGALESLHAIADRSGGGTTPAAVSRRGLMPS